MMSPSALARGFDRPYGRRVTSVAVPGGGVGGLSTAHELAEQGFDVTVYEARAALDGNARSMPVPGSGTGGRADLPAEHGFRFFPGFYRHLPDTMTRIPGAGGGAVADRLVDATRVSSRRPAGATSWSPPRGCRRRPTTSRWSSGSRGSSAARARRA